MDELANNPNSRRVLVVDDNKDGADSLARLLRLAGHRVEVAYSGQEALQAAQLHQPEVVLLDLVMPHIDGCSVARALRAHPETKGVFLIAVTGCGIPDEVERSRLAGFDLHLLKPVDPQLLLKVLRTGETAPSDTNVIPAQ